MASQEISKRNVYGYFIQDKKLESLPKFVLNRESDAKGAICSIDPDMKIVASCNQGIICCVKKLKGGDYRYYVGNPSTQQWQSIPNPKRGNDDDPKGIMVLPSSGGSLRFAIVRLTSKGSQEKRNAYQCEIFDSKFWAWCQYENLIMPTSPEFITHSSAVSSKSSFYWLTSEDNVVDLQFDQDGDNFKFEYIITGADKNNKYMKLVEFDDNLGYIIITEEGLMELWVMSKGVATTFEGKAYQQKDMKRWNLKVWTNLKKHEDQVKYPYHRGFYNVDNLEDLNKFREIICYEKLEDDDGFSNTVSTIKVRLQYPKKKKIKRKKKFKQQDDEDLSITTNTVRLDQLNVAADVFRVRLDSEPINLCPRPTFSDDAKKSKGLQVKQVRKLNRNVSIDIDGSSTSLVFIFVFVFLLSDLFFGGMKISGVE